MKIIMSSPNYFWEPNAECMTVYRGNKDILLLQFEKSPEEKSQKTNELVTINIGTNYGGSRQKSGFGRGGRVYMEVEKHLGEILQCIGSGEDVLVLSDLDPQSVIIYDLLKRNTNGKNFKLHFWGVLPLRFESRLRKEAYLDLLDGSGRVKSLYLIYADEYLEKIDRRCTVPQLLQTIKADLEVEFPEIIKSISGFKANSVYFFDRCSKRYIDASLSFETWKKEDSKNELYRMGEMSLHYDPYANEKKLVEQLMIRENGKDICRKLRTMRMDFAKANGIEFESLECGYEGPCAGTCEQCDSELEYLLKMKVLRPDHEVIYPFAEIESRAGKQREIPSDFVQEQLQFRRGTAKKHIDLPGIQIPGFLREKPPGKESADE